MKILSSCFAKLCRPSLWRKRTYRSEGWYRMRSRTRASATSSCPTATSRATRPRS
uniref:Uncharacterized protein n=1 Tax=Ciona savignyi TaxID=51511 RepID=H2Y5U4_CIOSA